MGKKKDGDTYKVKPGDSLAKIAGEVYGNQRMFAQISRLNGGVKSLKPGMVLKLPGKQKNEDIFISDNWAASMGMATSGDLKSFYAENPLGASATQAMKSGAWSPGYAGAVGGAGSPGVPGASGAGWKPGPQPGQPAASPSRPANYAQMASRGTNMAQPAKPFGPPAPVGLPPSGVPGKAQTQQPQRSMTSAPLATGDLFGQPRGTFNSGMANFGAPAKPPAPIRQAQAATQPQTWGEKINAAAGAFGNAMTGALPTGATVTGQRPATPAGQAAGGVAGQKYAVTDPRQYYSGVASIPGFTPTEILLNTPPETAARVAPYVNQAINSLVNTLASGGSMGGLTKTQVDLLMQAGILDYNNPVDVEVAYGMVSGKAPTATGLVNQDASPFTSGQMGGSTAGFWDPNTNLGAKPIWRQDIRREAAQGQSGGGGSTGSTSGGTQMQTYSNTSSGSNYGASLGLMNWRRGL